MFSPRFVGLVCIFLSAVGFGAMPIFAKFAYADGMDLTALLFLRFTLAGLLLAAVMGVRGARWPRGSNLCILMAMGGVAYSVQAFCYFAALHYATAGLTALLLYLYPVIVTLLSALFLRRKLSGMRVLAVLAALFGTGLAVGGSLDGSPLGIVLGVAAALIYSIYILVGERVTASEDAIASGAVVMLSASVTYAAVLLLGDGMSLPASPRWLGLGGKYCGVLDGAGDGRLSAGHAATGCRRRCDLLDAGNRR